MPMCLLEAMAASRACIATRVGAVPQLIPDSPNKPGSLNHSDASGLLIEPRNPVALAQAIMSLLADPIARQRMGAAARERVVRHYSANAMARTYLELYQRCTNYRGMDRTPVHEEN